MWGESRHIPSSYALLSRAFSLLVYPSPFFFFFLFSPRSHDPWSSINHKGASHCRAKETTWDRIDGVKESEIAGGDHDSTGERGGAESDNLSRFPRSKFHTLHPSYAPCHTPSHAVFFFFFWHSCLTRLQNRVSSGLVWLKLVNSSLVSGVLSCPVAARSLGRSR